MLGGAGIIRDGNGRLSGYVYEDVARRDIGSYVADAKKSSLGQSDGTPGYQLVWSGQHEFMQSGT
jgi:copper/silver efflux system protein